MAAQGLYLQRDALSPVPETRPEGHCGMIVAPTASNAGTAEVTGFKLVALVTCLQAGRVCGGPFCPLCNKLSAATLASSRRQPSSRDVQLSVTNDVTDRVLIGLAGDSSICYRRRSWPVSDLSLAANRNVLCDAKSGDTTAGAVSRRRQSFSQRRQIPALCGCTMTVSVEGHASLRQTILGSRGSGKPYVVLLCRFRRY
jgi:hypothetical protein